MRNIYKVSNLEQTVIHQIIQETNLGNTDVYFIKKVTNRWIAGSSYKMTRMKSIGKTLLLQIFIGYCSIFVLVTWDFYLSLIKLQYIRSITGYMIWFDFCRALLQWFEQLLNRCHSKDKKIYIAFNINLLS